MDAGIYSNGKGPDSLEEYMTRHRGTSTTTSEHSIYLHTSLSLPKATRRRRIMRPTTNEPIAIVGSACRFAGDATSPSKLWDLLREPRDVRSEIPDSRFSAKGFYHPNNAHHGRSNVKHSYLINDDLSLFDAEFFGIRHVEAKAIDPQQRWLMETVYEVRCYTQCRFLVLCSSISYG